MDLAEADDIKKRWQEYTEELYKKDLHDPDNHKGMITHIEPDILEWEVKQALGSITMNKAGGGVRIPVELFQTVKDESAALNMPANLENSAVDTGLEKVSFHSNPKERQCKRMFKLPHNCTHLTHQQSNARLDEARAGIKIARRNINNLRQADETTLMTESKEELKSLLIKVKEESENFGLKLNIQKAKIMASGPITSC